MTPVITIARNNDIGVASESMQVRHDISLQGVHTMGNGRALILSADGCGTVLTGRQWHAGMADHGIS